MFIIFIMRNINETLKYLIFIHAKTIDCVVLIVSEFIKIVLNHISCLRLDLGQNKANTKNQATMAETGSSTSAGGPKYEDSNAVKTAHFVSNYSFINDLFFHLAKCTEYFLQPRTDLDEMMLLYPLFKKYLILHLPLNHIWV